VTLLDHNGSGGLDIADAVALLRYLFASGAPPAAGPACVSVPDCAEVCPGG
jgi:hypothetical protein